MTQFAILDASGTLQYINTLPPLGQTTASESLPVVLPIDVPLPFPTAIAPIASTVLEASHVLKNAAGSLISLTVDIGATSGWIMLFDAITAPADGAVAAKWVGFLASNGTGGRFDRSWDVPLSFSVGITVVFSSTGPFSKTASAGAAFSAQVI